MKSNAILKIVEVIAFLFLIGIYSLLFVPFVIAFEPIKPIHIIAFSGGLIALNIIYGTISTWLKHRKKYMPRENAEYLYDHLDDLSAEFNTNKPRLVVFETDVPNAYATDTIPTRPIIAITTGLLDTLSEDEMKAVLAHEMSHVKSYDIFFMQFLATFVTIFEKIHGVTTGLIRDADDLFEKAVFLLPFILSWFNLMIVYTIVFFVSRVREFVADSDAANATTPTDMRNALKKITGSIEDMPESKQVKFSGASALTIAPLDHFKSTFFRTHPKTDSRLERLESIEDHNKPSAYERQQMEDQSDTDETDDAAEETEEPEQTEGEDTTESNQSEPEQTEESTQKTSDERKTVTEAYESSTEDDDDDIEYPTNLSFKDN